MSVETLSLAAAARALGLPAGKSGRLGKQRVYRMVSAGKLRAVRVGRELRVPVAELERFTSTSDAR